MVDIPKEYTVRIWRAGESGDEKYICKTQDDVKAVISDVEPPVKDGRVKIEIEAYQVAG